MNKNKLKELVSALDELSDDVKDWGVEMESYDKPACGTPGCHAGLIYIVAENLPELQDIYNPLYLLESKYRGKRDNQHMFYIWSTTLAIFLGFKSAQDLEIWAQDNPKFWGNKYGDYMFCARLAFTDDKSKHLTHMDIIEHWKQVLKNIEEEEVKNYEQR
jgi:hypothetical protein